MLLEMLKIILPLLGGGLAGAALNEFLRRRNAQVQMIPLIERINRVVDPTLKGFTLARIKDEHDERHLEEITNLREYQLSLRNTSTIHLQDVEIQFEFPTADVDGWLSRPVLSKTAPIPVEPVITEPWKKGFRWRIPHLPATDSIEFSFTAIDPPSGDYEAALYKTDRVILEKSKGEPKSKETRTFLSQLSFPVVSIALVVVVASLLVTIMNKMDHRSFVQQGGCILTVSTSFQPVDPDKLQWPWGGPWQISDSIINVGLQTCAVQLEGLIDSPVMLASGEEARRLVFSAFRPRLVSLQLRFGSGNPTMVQPIDVYTASADTAAK